MGNVIKYEQTEPPSRSCEFLFDEIHPESSYTSPPSIRFLASVVIAFLDIMMLVGQFIMLFGNQVHRYESRFFVVSAVLALKNPFFLLLQMLSKELSKRLLRVLNCVITVCLVIACASIPRYHRNYVIDLMVSTMMILVVITVSYNSFLDYSPKNSFYSSLLLPALEQYVIATAYPALHFIFINVYSIEDLLPTFIFGLCLQLLLSYQRLLFNSHVYANIIKYEGCWTNMTDEMEPRIHGHVDQWKPNYVYPFGSVVYYQDYKCVASGYLNTVKPFSPQQEFPFLTVFEKEKCHCNFILVHFLLTSFCCIQLWIYEFQLRFAVVAVISIVSLILTFPLHTMAFN